MLRFAQHDNGPRGRAQPRATIDRRRTGMPTIATLASCPFFRRPLLALAALILLWSACAPSPAPTSRPGEAPVAQAPAASAPAAPTSNRPLTIVNINEPVSLNARPLSETFISYFTVRQIFNASLAVLDDKALPRPRLAEAVPQLNTDSWRVFPDGRMETTWKLKPDLVWHD